MTFRKVAALDDLWSGEMISREVDGEPILLINIDDHIYAYADACPHQKSRLSEGTLIDKTIRCARHHWEFDICSGGGINPQNACLRGFKAMLDGEDILVDVNHGEVNHGASLRATVDEGNE
jgi:toluene monooxygenase system ferredoxin subunit